MQVEEDGNTIVVWKATYIYWGILALCALLLGYIFWDGLEYMEYIWGSQEEYSYGYLIPLISLFFVWQKKDDLQQNGFAGSWKWLPVLLFGLGLYFVGELSTLYTVIQYAFLLTLYGLLLTILGWRGFRIIWAPLLLLVFMIPLPLFLYQGLSAKLQLISTDLGVWVIRLFDISVYVEGNVIDLGVYKLQVVEACSGLRYLFPLMTLGFIAAYLYKVALWKRVVVFISTIPITVLMNSFRIGAIGVMVEYWGQSMAEGFLHDFEGWVIFMACTLILILEMWALARIGDADCSLSEVFGLDSPKALPVDAKVYKKRMRTPSSLFASLMFITIAVFFSSSLGHREQIIPERKEFASFPLELGDWKGRSDKLESIYLNILKLTDYVIADYVGPNGKSVNFYVAYYASQTKGDSAHSPRSCLPGGGWQIASLKQKTLDGAVHGQPINVNRVVIKRGEYKQLVYYWFQEQGLNITNEYMVKWYLFWNALTKNRTDGALIRLTTMLSPDENMQDADKRLEDFVRQVSGTLADYVPG